MKQFKLVSKTDLATGELGLMFADVRLIDTPMVANESLLLAHDLIEHQNGLQAIGSVDDELIALGGIWFTRGELNDIRRHSPGNSDPYENMASDICNLGMYFVQGVNFRSKVPKTNKHEQDDNFRLMIEMGRKELLAELGYNVEPIDYERVNAYCDACLHYLRKGYRMARKRFGSQYRANSLFWDIEHTLRHVVQEIEFEGQEFVLSVDFKNVRSYVDESYPEW